MKTDGFDAARAEGAGTVAYHLEFGVSPGEKIEQREYKCALRMIADLRSAKNALWIELKDCEHLLGAVRDEADGLHVKVRELEADLRLADKNSGAYEALKAERDALRAEIERLSSAAAIGQACAFFKALLSCTGSVSAKEIAEWLGRNE